VNWQLLSWLMSALFFFTWKALIVGVVLWWVAVLIFGEGWHNNHHASLRSAPHGLAWYEFDLNWYGILMLSILGLARDIKSPTLRPLGGVRRRWYGPS
jgi:fatty-acid desaturase